MIKLSECGNGAVADVFKLPMIRFSIYTDVFMLITRLFFERRCQTATVNFI